MTELTELLAAMIRLPSVNPCGRKPEDPYEGEARMTEFVQSWFAERGIESELQTVMDQRTNVIARVQGREEPPLVFEAHLDTVSVEGMTIPPFEPRIEEGRIFGRGSCDVKGGLAAMMMALVRAAEADPPPRSLVLVAAVDEEYLHSGIARFLRDSGPIAGAVVGEPTELRVVIAHKGAVRTRITTRGVSAHSSNPERGVNAVYRMARIVTALEEFAADLHQRPQHGLVGGPTLSVGTISGGTAVNVVPELCECMVDRRLIPGETPDAAFVEIRDLVSDLLDEDDDIAATLKDCAVETDRSEQIVGMAREAVREYTGEDEPEGVAYCTDGCDFAERGIPLVVLGPGDIAQAHTAEEWIAIQQVETAARIYEHMMRG